MSSPRGIEANPTKCRAIIDIKNPKEAKEVQILAGRIAALSCFMARSADKVRPLLQLLRKNTTFQWSKECDQAFQSIKQFIDTPPILTSPTQGTPLLLYLAILGSACSAVFIRSRVSNNVSILRKQNVARARGQIPEDRESSVRTGPGRQ